MTMPAHRILVPLVRKPPVPVESPLAHDSGVAEWKAGKQFPGSVVLPPATDPSVTQKANFFERFASPRQVAKRVFENPVVQVPYGLGKGLVDLGRNIIAGPNRKIEINEPPESLSGAFAYGIANPRGRSIEELAAEPDWQKIITAASFGYPGIGPGLAETRQAIGGIPTVGPAFTQASLRVGEAVQGVGRDVLGTQPPTLETAARRFKAPSVAFNAPKGSPEAQQAIYEQGILLQEREAALRAHPAYEWEKKLIRQVGKDRGEPITDTGAASYERGGGFDNLAKTLGYEEGNVTTIGTKPRVGLSASERLKWDLRQIFEEKQNLADDKRLFAEMKREQTGRPIERAQASMPKPQEVPLQTQTGGVMQAGFGIGEKPAQGGLFENVSSAPNTAMPLIDAEAQAARDAVRAQEAAGQTRFRTFADIQSDLRQVHMEQGARRQRSVSAPITAEDRQLIERERALQSEWRRATAGMNTSQLANAQFSKEAANAPTPPLQAPVPAQAGRAVAQQPIPVQQRVAEPPLATPTGQPASTSARVATVPGGKPPVTAPDIGDIPRASPLDRQADIGNLIGPEPVGPGGRSPRGPLDAQGRLGEPPGGKPPVGVGGGMPPRPPVEPPRPNPPLPGMERPPLGNNIIGLREITPGLTKGEERENIALGAGRKVRLPFHLNNEYGTAAVREKNRVASVINSQATQLAHRQAVAIRQAFKLEDDLFVPSLEGRVSRVKGAPSIQDIADFYPQYETYLTAAQKKALEPIWESHDAYKDLLNKVGVGIGSRESTQIGGGRYIARVAKGLLKDEEISGVPTKGLFASERKGFEQEIRFETAAAGRVAGIKYAGIEDTLRFHYRQAGQRATEQHLANYLSTVVDPTNWPISVPKPGEGALGRKWVDLPVLADISFPEAVANSINKVLVSEGATVGKGREVFEAVRILNNGYRGVRATLDNSYAGIQALLASYSHPLAAARALRLNFNAWRDPNVLARSHEMFDARAAKTGRLTVSQWVSEGELHQGAISGEFIAPGLQNLPVFKQAQRAFSFHGDGLRPDLADVLLEQEMSGYSIFGIGNIGKGRTLAEVRASGDIAEIGRIVNNMTGVAKSRFGGEVGDVLLFAPRFFQARLETVAKGLAGLRPGASLEQKIARRSLLKMMVIGTSMTVALNALNGEDTDVRPIVNGRKNNNFMRVRALGRDWSLFGTWDSLLGILIAAGHGDAEGALRAQGSGLVTTTWDLISGEDFVGRSTVSAADKVKYVLRQMLPFSGPDVAQGAETVLTGKPTDIAAGAVTVAGSLLGGKSSKLSPTEVIDRSVAKETGRKDTPVADLLEQYHAIKPALSSKLQAAWERDQKRDATWTRGLTPREVEQVKAAERKQNSEQDALRRKHPSLDVYFVEKYNAVPLTKQGFAHRSALQSGTVDAAPLRPLQSSPTAPSGSGVEDWRRNGQLQTAGAGK